ncbi:hypothetical protein [Chlorogloeopsis sp. ULAP02]|uniref:hypothetical protein n=1 Tax=Chlorogloeopsis sp. ULAP02 TaxID=3107926 RepID=UPI003136F83B
MKKILFTLSVFSGVALLAIYFLPYQHAVSEAKQIADLRLLCPIAALLGDPLGCSLGGGFIQKGLQQKVSLWTTWLFILASISFVCLFIGLILPKYSDIKKNL